jgi:hypothetical protein
MTKCLGVCCSRDGSSCPSCANLMRTFASASASTTAAFNLARISLGVPLGAQIAFHTEISPDGHVAWRSDNIAADAASVIEAVRGAVA